jgi:glycerol-3-phosphate dehydrogenase (NAD(P)+)
MKKIAVIGGGAWGTALAHLMSKVAEQVVICSRNEEIVTAINNSHENPKYASGVKLSPLISAYCELEEVLDADLVVVAIPAQSLRHLAEQLKSKNLPRTTKLILACKGIEQNSLLLMSEVIEEIIPGQPIAILSGPNFASEILQDLPAASTLAAFDLTMAQTLASKLGNENFRIYSNHDVIGTQIGGAVKNILAIACGIIVGRKFGENAKSALITRGLAEMKRICVAKGGNPETLSGLSGLGDLVLTCGSIQSRNTNVGYRLGRQEKLIDILNQSKGIAEGIPTAKSVKELAQRFGLSTPICEAVYSILYDNGDIDQAIHQLLSRPLTDE